LLKVLERVTNKTDKDAMRLIRMIKGGKIDFRDNEKNKWLAGFADLLMDTHQ